MLGELLRWCATPCSRVARELGHLSGVISIASRHGRCGRHWQAHLDTVKAVMLEAARSCPSRRTVAVAGSGLLLDVPLEELAGLFQRVILVDMVHPRSARRRARRLGNVDCLDADVTGLGDRLLAARRRGEAPDLAAPAVSLLHDRTDLDLVISDNLLSQIYLPFTRYCRRHGPSLTPEQEKAFGREMVSAHLAWLRGFSCRVCLIADLARVTTDGDRELERRDILCGVDPGDGASGSKAPDARWIWRLAPRPEARKDADVHHELAAWLDWRG